MKVFLSWSGDHSHAVAQAFNEWLPSVLQSLTPWLSSEHIAKGATWLTDIQKALSESNGVGIFFLTQEAMRSEWMLFEAGGIAALDKHRVCTVCVDMQPADLKPPLNFFQATKLIKDEVWRLVMDLNKQTVVPLAESVLKKSFDRAWPDLEHALQEATPKAESQIRASSSKAPPVSVAHIEQLMEGLRRIELRIGRLEEMQTDAVLGQWLERDRLQSELNSSGVEQNLGLGLPSAGGNPFRGQRAKSGLLAAAAESVEKSVSRQNLLSATASAAPDGTLASARNALGGLRTPNALEQLAKGPRMGK